MAIAAEERPQSQQRKNRECYRFGQRSNSAEGTEKRPLTPTTVIFQPPSEIKQPSDFECDQACGPGPIRAVVHAVGRERPSPAGPLCDAIAEGPLPQKIYRDARQSGEETVQRQAGDDRRRRLNSEDLENARE